MKIVFNREKREKPRKNTPLPLSNQGEAPLKCAAGQVGGIPKVNLKP